MITLSELYPIGRVAKTHGVQGELNISLDTDYNPEDFRFLVFELDNIFVPFVIGNVRGQNDAFRIVALDGVDGVEDAKPFVGKTVYVLNRERAELPGFDGDETGLYLSDLVGYGLFDAAGAKIGEIVGFNDDTQNYLLEVRKDDDGTVAYVPYVDEWIAVFDPDEKRIAMDLPAGLI